MSAPLRVAVPDLDGFAVTSGIGRVLVSLGRAWGERVTLLPARTVALRWPLLRQLPHRIEAPEATDLVLLPRMLGATALRNTGGPPSVLIMHDLGALDMAVSGDRPVDPIGHQLVLRHWRAVRRADRVVAVSRFTGERLRHHLPEVSERLTVIPNGVDVALFDASSDRASVRRELARTLDAPLGSPLLLYVGSESPRKNLPLLLATLAELRERHPGVQLVKVGGPDHPSFRQATLAGAAALDLEVGRHLLILEGLDDALLARLYRAADAFVSASLYEGFGLPPLEALASGTPAVVCDRGALPEVVGDVGFVSDPARPAFVAAVEAALGAGGADDARRYREHAERFSWRRSAERYLELFRRLVGAEAPGRVGREGNAWPA